MSEKHSSTEKKTVFGPDSPFMAVMTRLFDLLLLNILWLLTSLPLLTIGGAYAGLYTVTLSWSRGEEPPVIRTFFTAFRRNVKQGMGVSILLLLGILLFVLDLHFAGRMTASAGRLLYGVLLVLLLFAVAVVSYLLPLFARFENTLLQTLNNAWRLAVTNLPRTAGAAALHALPVLWFLFFPETFFGAAFLWGFLGTAVTAYLCSLLFRPVFVRLEGGAAKDSEEGVSVEAGKDREV